MKLAYPSKLTVAVLSMVHVMELSKTADSSYKISGGLEGELLKILLDKSGFEYEMVVPADGEYGRLRTNGSWTGLIGMVERGEADLAFGGLAITTPRQKAVDFIPLIEKVKTTFAIKKAENLRLKNAYLYPFRSSVWTCFLGLFFAMTAALWLVFEKKYAVGRIIFELWGNALRQPFTISADLWKAKFLLAATCAYFLVMTASYSGVLLSFMTVPVKGETVETLEQLAAAVAKGTHRCYVHKGTLMVHFLLSVEDKNLNLLGEAIQRNNWYLESMDVGALKMISPNDAIISVTFFFEIAFGSALDPHSKYLISNDAISALTIGLAVKRNFCCKKKLDRIAKRMFESGFSLKSMREAVFFNMLESIKMEKEVEKENKISYDDITGALTILYLGYAVSFITLLAEILLSKCGMKIPF